MASYFMETFHSKKKFYIFHTERTYIFILFKSLKMSLILEFAKVGKTFPKTRMLIFQKILSDLSVDTQSNGCRHFHFMPRFARALPNNGKEILSMHHVMQYLMRRGKRIMDPDRLDDWLHCDQTTWTKLAGTLKNTIATCPGKVR